MTEIVDDEWLTVKKGAKVANVCTWTVYQACKRRELRHSRISGKRSIRLTRAALDEWMRGFERPPSAGAPPATVTTSRR
jgi:excisionase family DNA binding protein